MVLSDASELFVLPRSILFTRKNNFCKSSSQGKFGAVSYVNASRVTLDCYEMVEQRLDLGFHSEIVHPSEEIEVDKVVVEVLGGNAVEAINEVLEIGVVGIDALNGVNALVSASGGDFHLLRTASFNKSFICLALIGAKDRTLHHMISKNCIDCLVGSVTKTTDARNRKLLTGHSTRDANLLLGKTTLGSFSSTLMNFARHDESSAALFVVARV